MTRKTTKRGSSIGPKSNSAGLTRTRKDTEPNVNLPFNFWPSFKTSLPLDIHLLRRRLKLVKFALLDAVAKSRCGQPSCYMGFPPVIQTKTTPLLSVTLACKTSARSAFASSQADICPRCNGKNVRPAYQHSELLSRLSMSFTGAHVSFCVELEGASKALMTIVSHQLWFASV